MNPVIKQNQNRTAFTIVELLTVMSIIVILIGLLVPALNNVKRYAKEVRQKAQFHSIDAAIELFSNEFDGYPASNAMDGQPNSSDAYCGVMKLCEAMMGQDLMGFHPDSDFIRDGTDRAGRPLYVPGTLTARRPPYLPLENANAYKLRDIYGDNVAPFLPDIYVLCDVYTRQVRTGMKVGMPILYYKADTTANLHDPNTNPNPFSNAGNIYNYYDNQFLVLRGKPWEEGVSSTHALADPERFYKNTRNHKIQQPPRPYRADSYILISAGFDGEYGTADDVCNFEWKYRE